MTLTPERRAEIETMVGNVPEMQEFTVDPDTLEAWQTGIVRDSATGWLLINSVDIIRELLAEIDRLNTAISHIREYVRASTDDGYMSSVDIIDEYVGNPTHPLQSQ